jgi:hypothetical protein
VRDFFGAVPGAETHGGVLGQVTDALWTFRLPMPFATGAKIELVNESAVPLTTRARTLVEVLPGPAADRGRLHAAWRRTVVGFPGVAPLLAAEGTRGQVVALRLDGTLTSGPEGLGGLLKCRLDGGAEQVAASSWVELLRGEKPPALPEAGVTVRARPNWRRRVAGYRLFPDPVRFARSVELNLEWPNRPGLPSEADLTSTVFWYADRPMPHGGRPLAFGDRVLGYLGLLAAPAASPQDMFEFAPTDANPVLELSGADELGRVQVFHAAKGYPRWLAGGGAGKDNPHPGRQGILALAPPEPGVTCRLYWKVRLPPGASKLSYAFSIDPYEAPGRTDVVVHVTIYDGKVANRVRELVVGGNVAPCAEGWLAETVPIGRPTSGDVLVMVDVFGGGPRGAWTNEELFIDRLALE